MDAKRYQHDALRTKGQYNGWKDQLVCAAMGLAGEAGEVSEPIKKWLWHGHALDREKVLDELSDVLWYVALAADALDSDMGRLMEHNIAKLTQRYPDGFNPVNSIFRGDQIPSA